VFGLLIGPIGFYIRRHLNETPEFIAAPASSASLRELFPHQLDRVLLAIGIAVISNSSNYLILFMPTYAATQLTVPASTGFIATFLGGLILTIGSPVIGHWSNKVGRTRIMIAAAALFLITAYPAFLLLTALPTMAVIVRLRVLNHRPQGSGVRCLRTPLHLVISLHPPSYLSDYRWPMSSGTTTSRIPAQCKVAAAVNKLSQNSLYAGHCSVERRGAGDVAAPPAAGHQAGSGAAGLVSTPARRAMAIIAVPA
jgi:hypothetical protein